MVQNAFTEQDIKHLWNIRAWISSVTWEKHLPWYPVATAKNIPIECPDIYYTENTTCCTLFSTWGTMIANWEFSSHLCARSYTYLFIASLWQVAAYMFTYPYKNHIINVYASIKKSPENRFLTFSKSAFSLAGFVSSNLMMSLPL